MQEHIDTNTPLRIKRPSAKASADDCKKDDSLKSSSVKMENFKNIDEGSGERAQNRVFKHKHSPSLNDLIKK